MHFPKTFSKTQGFSRRSSHANATTQLVIKTKITVDELTKVAKVISSKTKDNKPLTTNIINPNQYKKVNKIKAPISSNIIDTRIVSKIKSIPRFSVLHTASRRLHYFVRKGNKEGIEGLFHNFILNRALKNKTQQKQQPGLKINSITVIQHKPVQVHTHRSLHTLFETFYLAATPYIALKIRRKRRGKRVVHKLNFRDSARSERKSFVGLASLVSSKGRASKPVRVRLEQELESLTNQSRQRKSSSPSIRFATNANVIAASSAISTSLREKRDLLHRTAFFARPYR